MAERTICDGAEIQVTFRRRAALLFWHLRLELWRHSPLHSSSFLSFLYFSFAAQLVRKRSAIDLLRSGGVRRAREGATGNYSTLHSLPPSFLDDRQTERHSFIHKAPFSVPLPNPPPLSAPIVSLSPSAKGRCVACNDTTNTTARRHSTQSAFLLPSSLYGSGSVSISLSHPPLPSFLPSLRSE